MVRVKRDKSGKSGPDSCRFRRFRLSDLKQVMAIEKEAFPDPLPPVIILFLAASTRFIIADYRGKVAGYLSLGYEDRKTSHIYRIAFSSIARGKGLGTQIMSRFVKKPCSVMTNEKNEGSIRFYERFGFRLVKKIKKKSKTLVYLVFN